MTRGSRPDEDPGPLRRRLQTWARRTPREWYWALQRRLAPRRPFRFPFDGTLTIEVALGDELGFHYALGREFEPQVCDFFRKALRPGMVVFDLGANIGQYTLLAAKRVGPGGSVHAFEPAPEEYRKLCVNVEINGLANVVANPLAVCDRTGETALHTAGRGLGLYNSLGRPIRSADADVVRVPCTTLDDYVRAANVARVDLIKMDVEGAELAVVRGATELLSRSAAPVIVCEFSDPAAAGMGHTTADLRRALEAFGYRVYRYDIQHGTLTAEAARERYDYDNLVCSKQALFLGATG